MSRKRYTREAMVTLAELTARVRALLQTSYAPRRPPSEGTVRKRVASLGIQTGKVALEGGRRDALRRKDADRVVESFRRQDAERAFDQELLGFCIEPELGSSDNRIGAGLPWSHRFAPPGVRVDDPGPAHDLQVSMDEVIENFRARNSDDAAALEALRQRIRGRLRGQPEGFSVVFHVSASDLDSYLMGVVGLIPVPRELGADADDFRLQAFEHLRLVTLPHISEARQPKSYLANAVQNFYRDAIDATEELLLLDEEALSRTRLLSQSQEVSSADPDPDPHDDDGR